MNQETAKLVQQSWAKVIPIAPQAAALFYSNLFMLDPNLKPLFKGDMEDQGHKLIQMLGAAIDMLDSLEKLVPILQNLGARHADYGVESIHYRSVGEALLMTLSQGLGTSSPIKSRKHGPPSMASWQPS